MRAIPRSVRASPREIHNNWGNDDQRKVVLNAILWTAKAEVPAGGVPSKVTPEELAANLDKKR